MTPIMVASLYHSMHLSTHFGLSLVKLQFHSPIFSHKLPTIVIPPKPINGDQGKNYSECE